MASTKVLRTNDMCGTNARGLSSTDDVACTDGLIYSMFMLS